MRIFVCLTTSIACGIIAAFIINASSMAHSYMGGFIVGSVVQSVFWLVLTRFERNYA